LDKYPYIEFDYSADELLFELYNFNLSNA